MTMSLPQMRKNKEKKTLREDFGLLKAIALSAKKPRDKRQESKDRIRTNWKEAGLRGRIGEARNRKTM